MSEFRYSYDNFDEPEPLSNRPETIWGVIISCLIKGFLQTFYIGNAAYVTSTALIKEALLLQYLRVFDRGVFTYCFVIPLIVFTALWGFAYSFLAWIPCMPVREFWGGEQSQNCYGYGSRYPGPFVATFQSHAAVNMALDVLVLIIPLPLFFKEGITRGTRLRLVGLLSMGVFVIGFATWRLVTIIEHQVATRPTRDPTWYGPISIVLAVLEVDAASVCASVPIFWPVLRRLQWGKIFVTQEVNITRETRYMDDDEDRLTRSTTHSRTGSETDSRGNGGGKCPRSKETYYQDSYVLSQVDPLRTSVERVQVSARSETAKGGSRKWMKI
ncbi:hypothetical protein AAE478_009071 [Parahypoxylon ruwenzoriense]